MTTLQYNGDFDVDPSNDTRINEIVGAMREAVQDSSLEFGSGNVRSRDGQITVRFDLRLETTIGNAEADQQQMAQQLVALGVEPDEQTAIESIRL